MISMSSYLPDHGKSIDFTKRNGTGGESIYGGTFGDEDLSMPVDKEGYVISCTSVSLS